MIGGAKRAIMFCAHTDDEMIAAGTLHRMVREGCEVHVVAFGPAATKKDRVGGHESWEVLEPEWHRSMETIGVKSEHRIYSSCVPSSDMERYKQFIADTSFKIIESVWPDVVFTLSPEDENPAHAVVGIQTERVMRGRVPVTLRCQYPWNYSIGRANMFVTLTPEDLEAKRKVINCYQSQLWRYGYEEMLIAATRLDGLSVKVEAAEKFEVVRGVI